MNTYFVTTPKMARKPVRIPGPSGVKGDWLLAYRDEKESATLQKGKDYINAGSEHPADWAKLMDDDAATQGCDEFVGKHRALASLLWREFVDGKVMNDDATRVGRIMRVLAERGGLHGLKDSGKVPWGKGQVVEKTNERA